MFNKLKKLIYSLFLISLLLPAIVSASQGSLVKVGDKYYDNLTDAIENANETDIITLISDVKLDDTLKIDKVVNLNLNRNTISAKERVFLVEGGTLNLTGKGTIKETNPKYGAITLKGSSNKTDSDYSVLKVGKDITLEGWSGIFITHNNKKSYGVKATFSGTINALDNSSGGKGAGIYINGNIQEKNNSPIVNILDGAKITSTGNGLYIAGYGTYNINEAEISGDESGIGIKAGILNIDGANIYSNGPDKTPTEGYGNGINASGAAIQIESNNGYAGDIELNIDSGSFTSKNSNTIYEYIGAGTSSQVIALDIAGGVFKSSASKENFNLSDSLKQYHQHFIHGGRYSKNPDAYLKEGYSSSLEDDTYLVTKSTLKSVFKTDNLSSSNSNLGVIATAIIVTIIAIVIYLYKSKVIVFSR